MIFKVLGAFFFGFKNVKIQKNIFLGLVNRMPFYRKEYEEGRKSELDVLPIIANYFGRELKTYPEVYAKYDYHDSNTNYELKSRRFQFDKYPTTMITLDKTANTESDKDLIFIFNFTDKITYIKYDKEKFAKYEVKEFSRWDRQDKPKQHLYIPITDLTLICAK